MSRRLFLCVLGVIGAGVFVSAAPMALRHVSFFRLRQIELVGVRYQPPALVLERLGLQPDHNLFASVRDIERRAAALPGIESVEIKRRLPATLRITVKQRVPVAWAPTSSGLVALDGDARPLPYDPAAMGLDLPIVESGDSGLVRALATLQAADSAFYQQVDAARRGPGDVIILELGREQVMLEGVPTANEIRAIGAVRRHLAVTGRPFDQLDARFAGRVVVRRSGA